MREERLARALVEFSDTLVRDFDAYRSGQRLAVPDLRRVGRRWPVFTPRALGAGMAGRVGWGVAICGRQ